MAPDVLLCRSTQHIHNVNLEEVLTQLIAAGMIEAVEENGETLVAVDKNGNGNSVKGPQTKGEIIAAEFAHLHGQPITLSGAAKKYDVPRGTIRDWYYNSYIIPTQPDSYPMMFDEAEIAYCADIYHERKRTGTGFYGASLLDKNGLPYPPARLRLTQIVRTVLSQITSLAADLF